MTDTTIEPALDAEAREIFKAARERFALIDKLQKETTRDARKLSPMIIGKQLVRMGVRYQITEVRNAWDGTISARGHRILANGKKGSQIWDIGFITETHFDEA